MTITSIGQFIEGRYQLYCGNQTHFLYRMICAKISSKLLVYECEGTEVKSGGLETINIVGVP